MNRPEKRNALNLELCKELVDAIDKADADSGVGAIVLNANGPAFCAGMDLKETLGADHAHLGVVHDRLFTTIHRICTPIVAAIHGAALAGGAGLAANTHVAVARQDALFGLTEVRIGLWPVLIFRAIEHAIGERRAVELSLTGREFTADEALKYGLVTEIAEDPLRRATEIAKQLAGFSPIAIAAGLDYVHQIRGHDWEYAGKVGRVTRSRLLSSEDFKEGARAFLERRSPSWPSLNS